MPWIATRYSILIHDRPVYRPLLSQLPNVITLVRIASVPPLVWLLQAGEYRLAFWLGLAAALSDGIDGWLARHFHWQSRFGGLLDPVADKLLLDATYLGLAVSGHLPMALALLVAARDVVIVLGAMAYHYWVRALQPEPSWLSKITTVIQMALALGVLFHLTWVPVPLFLIEGLTAAVAGLTLLSALDYIVRWSLRAKRDWAMQNKETDRS